MYSKISPLRIVVASILVVVMVGLLTYTQASTSRFTAERFFGIGLSVIGIGVACIIISVKKVFNENGQEAAREEIQRLSMWIKKYNTQYISTGNQILSAKQFVRLTHIQWLSMFGARLIVFGGISIAISFLVYIF